MVRMTSPFDERHHPRHASGRFASKTSAAPAESLDQAPSGGEYEDAILFCVEHLAWHVVEMGDPSCEFEDGLGNPITMDPKPRMWLT